MIPSGIQKTLMIQTGTLTLLMFSFYATKLGGQVNVTITWDRFEKSTFGAVVISEKFRINFHRDLYGNAVMYL